MAISVSQHRRLLDRTWFTDNGNTMFDVISADFGSTAMSVFTKFGETEAIWMNMNYLGVKALHDYKERYREPINLISLRQL